MPVGVGIVRTVIVMWSHGLRNVHCRLFVLMEANSRHAGVYWLLLGTAATYRIGLLSGFRNSARPEWDEERREQTF
jgi:hypothetical protein